MEIWNETLPSRILAMQKLEKLLERQGYIICQRSGEKIYNVHDIVTIFLPCSQSVDLVMAVHKDYAQVFLRSCLTLLNDVQF
jgi:hypothetical protein